MEQNVPRYICNLLWVTENSGDSNRAVLFASHHTSNPETASASLGTTQKYGIDTWPPPVYGIPDSMQTKNLRSPYKDRIP